MGYLTYYSLECIEDGKQIDPIDHQQQIAEFTDIPVDYLWDDMPTWYNHTEDLSKYSKLHPNTLFILYGDGEHNDDLWVEYHLNGKVQYEDAKIVYPPFNEKLLEDI